MNRNTESYFSLQPSVNISRSKFDRSAGVKTTFQCGDIIVHYLEEVLPGDSFNVKTSKVIRMPSLVTPIFDNIYLDTYYFFVPNRLVWDHWKEFCGENTESAWIPQTEYSIPQITSPDDTGWAIGTIADYMGVRTGVPNLSVNALPFRAYALIMNEWFRSQSLSDPLVVPKDDSTLAGMNDGNELERIAAGGYPYRATKYKDYFTSCLPGPQKGPDVSINIVGTDPYRVLPMENARLSYEDYVAAGADPYGITYTSVAQNNGAGWYPLALRSDTDTSLNNDPVEIAAPAASGGTISDSSVDQLLLPTNLVAFPNAEGSAVTISDLRIAFQIQKFYEKQARSGSRYTEVVRSFFGVISPDARLQRPEYLGGNRIPINITQVVQQSGTQSTGTPQGTVVGMSQTTDVHADFVKSFTEHGYIIGLMVARYDHTYQQGLDRLWTRRDKFDFYWPVFSNISEQAVKNSSIYVQGTPEDDEVFGYQEAWAEYRYKRNSLSGHMRSDSPISLDVWHLADDYAELPKLSDAWIREDPNNLNRVLAVSDDISHQFFADIYVQNICTRPMPLYSIPGLIDHH